MKFTVIGDDFCGFLLSLWISLCDKSQGCVLWTTSIYITA